MYKGLIALFIGGAWEFTGGAPPETVPVQPMMKEGDIMRATRGSHRQQLIQIIVGGTLGVAMLMGWPTVSVAGEQPGSVQGQEAQGQPPSEKIQERAVRRDPSSGRICTQLTLDTWLCVVDGKEYICPSPEGPVGGIPCKYNPPNTRQAQPGSK